MKSSRSVLIYTSSDFPYGKAAENFVRQMALGLKENNIEVIVIRLRGRSFSSINDTGVKCYNLAFSRRPTNEFLKIIELISIVILIPFSLLRNYLKYKPKSIILYGIEYFYFVLPFLLSAKLLHLKLLRIITDFYSNKTISPVWWKRPKMSFYKLQFQFLDKYLDGIITLTGYLYDQAINNGIEKNRVEIIPHFINVKGFTNNLSYNNEKDIMRIGYCGTANKENGIYVLIDAYTILRKENYKVELLIIGAPSDEVKDYAMNKLTHYKDQVIMTGFLEKAQLINALASCDILVNPRISGILADAGFPTKLGEYFAMKKPVISTKTGDIGKYFTNKKELVLVEPDNPKDLATGMMYLINHKSEAESISKNGFDWACENVDYYLNSKKLIEFMNRI